MQWYRISAYYDWIRMTASLPWNAEQCLSEVDMLSGYGCNQIDDNCNGVVSMSSKLRMRWSR